MSESTPPFSSEKLTAPLDANAKSPLLEMLGQAVIEAYNAYDNATDPVFPGWKVVAHIKVWETAVLNKKHGPGYQLFGFAAVSDDGKFNLIALRGTVTDEEAYWVNSDWKDPVPFHLKDKDGKKGHYGNVQPGSASFYQGTGVLYKSLADSLKEAVAKLDPSVPLFVTAHSLGGAMAHLGALDIVVSGSYPNPTNPPIVVTFGSLKVGDADFAQVYDKAVPSTFGVVNVCDFVPSLVGLAPPAGNPPPPTPYVPVGTPLIFGWQKGDDWANHSMVYTYQVTIAQYLDSLRFMTVPATPFSIPS